MRVKRVREQLCILPSRSKVYGPVGRIEVYGAVNWPIATRVVTERYDN